jgi:hypothetical protein
LDLYLPTLPWYYQAYLWDGVPYYYVDGNYWVWNGAVGAYEQVQPPAQIAAQGQAPAEAGRLFVYPREGQTAQQQSKDETQCSQWASAQTGYTPPSAMAGQGGESAHPDGGAMPAKPQEYLRAEGACLEARGYSIG